MSNIWVCKNPQFINIFLVVFGFYFIFAKLKIHWDFSIGGLAQLARALAWHARGRRFDPDTLHEKVLKVCKVHKVYG